MKAIPPALFRPSRTHSDLSHLTNRFVMSDTKRQCPQQAEATATSTLASPPIHWSASRQPFNCNYGSIRKSWRGYMDKLLPYPKVQQLALDAATFFTKPEDLDFHWPRTFHDKYTLGHKLGAGTFGDVYRAVPKKCQGTHEVQLDLAVKVVPKSRVRCRNDYIALLQEAHMMDILSGTLQVVHLFGTYEDQTTVFFVMEQCCNNDAWALKGEPLQEEQAKKYMREILHVVSHCHSLQILHRDLKLENFLRADKKHNSPLKLTDFGSAVFLNKGEVLKDIRGTPVYTAPEVLCHNYSFPSDLWSCGVILYRLLSGHFPFESGPLLNECIKHNTIDVTSSPWPGISNEAKTLLSQLLERDESKRLSAKAALQHPWLSSSTVPLTSSMASKEISEPALKGTLVQRLQLYRSLNRFQQVVLYEVTRLLPLYMKEAVLGRFSTVFCTNDTKGVGFEEFAGYVAANGYHLTQGEVRGFVHLLDLNSDGRLSKDEVSAALLDWPQLQHDEMKTFASCLNHVFYNLDQDHDGYVTVLNVATLPLFQTTGELLHSFRNDSFIECFQSADHLSQKRIDLEDFRHLFRLPAHASSRFPSRQLESQ
ncbi:hypothetical protein CCR75_001296 [Bremia lactucae]|uniref:Calmodulin n=1 Tax=Bremia lactucae TaxID=4779 RepID=A0A976FNE5_BRELC|nr:hypothetical protein CCR75_001296 [Bremia lactucae]